MANALTSEVRAVQNPALGAMLLWRCAVGYAASHEKAEAIPLPLLYLVLPIMFHKDTAELVTSTHRASGLRKFAEKFQAPGQQSKTDLLLAVGPRAKVMRRLSSESLGLAVLGNLIQVEETGRANAMSKTPAASGIPSSVRPMLSGAEKLGAWFSGLSLYETALFLQVSF